MKKNGSCFRLGCTGLGLTGVLLAAGVLVTMNVGRCPELVAFLLGFGPDCEVLEPAKLREEIATAAMKLAAVYGHTHVSRPFEAPR